MKNLYMCGLALTISLSTLYAATATAKENNLPVYSSTSYTLTEAQKIDSLISYIKSLKGATFIRNGSEHSCQEAAKHLQDKYAKHADKIKTAQSFIEHLASKSSMSGEPYKVKFDNGEVKLVQQMLEQKLKELENTK